MLTGCGTKDSPAQDIAPADNTKPTISAATSTPVPEITDNKKTVKITLPASFFESGTQTGLEEIDESVIFDVITNDDGSKTYTMDKNFHDKLMDDYKKGTDEVIQETLNNEEAYLSFIDISYNDDMSEFKVMCDREKYNEFDAFIALAFYIQGDFYRMLNEDYDASIDTVVYFIDYDTGEIIYSADSSVLDNEPVPEPTLSPTQKPKEEVKKEPVIEVEEDYSDWVEFRTDIFDIVREGMWDGEVIHVEDDNYLVSPKYYKGIIDPYLEGLKELEMIGANENPRDTLLNPDTELIYE